MWYTKRMEEESSILYNSNLVEISDQCDLGYRFLK